ncbi:hypothetical protein RDI58_016601 [Solanum bulbocastanum]|uniref:RNase H type-1 domain-containing protein n=1 Tax=Solanum bulbocastanum TaxID=147425 RepID=A0AAN8TQK0_SOLBU
MWSKEVFGNIFQQIATLEDMIRIKENQFEINPLAGNRTDLSRTEAELKKYLKIEEEYWKQKAGMRRFVDGDKNIKFFHSYVKGRRKKLHLSQITNEIGEFQTNHQMGEAAVAFFSAQFKEEGNNQDWAMLNHIPRTSTSLWSNYMGNKYCKKRHPTVSRSVSASHVWKKMEAMREEVEHEIWWQLKAGTSSFWFDNWTKQGAFYYTEGESAWDEEIEVKEFIEEGSWNRRKLRDCLSEEMTEPIVNNILPCTSEMNDKAWWMGSSVGNFTVKSAYHLVRHKREQIEYCRNIWIKTLPFKISFFLWRVWKKRIAIDDNLRRMRMNIVSKCYCCERGETETMQHLLLTALIAQRLWRQFATCAEGIRGKAPNGFCIRDNKGDLVYAEAQNIGITTNMEAETTAVWKALQHCKRQGITHIILETDSLSLKNMIRRDWKVPWTLIERIEEIQGIMNILNAQVVHIDREGNQLVDCITNIAINHEDKQLYASFYDLTIKARNILNMDKHQIPAIRIRTRRITNTSNHQLEG